MSRKTLGLTAAALVVLLLSASLGAHLYSRWRFQRSATEFLATFPEVVPALDVDTLRQTFADLAHEGPPEELNAARWLIAGGDAIVCTQEENSHLTELVFAPSEDWTPDDRHFARELVERNKQALELMAKAVPLEGSRYELDYDHILDTEIPNLLHLMRGAKLLQVNARLAFTEGDIEGGIRNLAVIARLVDSLRDDDVLIFTLVGFANERFLLGGIRDALGSDALRTAEGSAPLFDRLEALLPEDDVLATMHRLTGLDAASMTFALRQGRGDMVEPPISSLRLRFFALAEAAEALDEGVASDALIEVPFARDPETYLPDGSAGLRSAYRTSIAKAQSIVAERQLVRAALHLERQREGCSALGSLGEPDPFTGEPLECTTAPDGGIHLALHPSSAALDKVTKQRIIISDIHLPAWPTTPDATPGN
jgi:hypothetical protein